MSTKLNGSKYCLVSLKIKSNISHFFYTQLNVKSVLFQTVHFSISTQFKCQTVLFDPWIGPCQVLPLQARGVLRIPQTFSLTGTSPSDYLKSYPRHSLEKSYPSAEMSSVYSTALTDSTRWGSSSGKCQVLFHCNYSHVHSGLECQSLLESHLWIQYIDLVSLFNGIVTFLG